MAAGLVSAWFPCSSSLCDDAECDGRLRLLACVGAADVSLCHREKALHQSQKKANKRLKFILKRGMQLVCAQEIRSASEVLKHFLHHRDEIRRAVDAVGRCRIHQGLDISLHAAVYHEFQFAPHARIDFYAMAGKEIAHHRRIPIREFGDVVILCAEMAGMHSAPGYTRESEHALGFDSLVPSTMLVGEHNVHAMRVEVGDGSRTSQAIVLCDESGDERACAHRWIPAARDEDARYASIFHTRKSRFFETMEDGFLLDDDQSRGSGRRELEAHARDGVDISRNCEGLIAAVVHGAVRCLDA